MNSIYKYKTPVYYHIPRTGGTYMLDFFLASFRYFIKEYTNWTSFSNGKNGLLKILHIKKDNFILARFLICDPYFIIEGNTFINEVDIDSMDTNHFFEKIFLFAVIVESRGFSFRNKILEILKNESIFEFTVLRDPFYRLQSLYAYLTTDSSIHENDRPLIKSKTFEEYLLSREAEDNWLCRIILNISENGIILNQELFEKAYSILSNIKFYDFNNLFFCINHVLHTCYDIGINHISEIYTNFSLRKNKSNYKIIKLENLSDKAVKQLEKKIFWDKKIYNIFINENISNVL